MPSSTNNYPLNGSKSSFEIELSSSSALSNNEMDCRPPLKKTLTPRTKSISPSRTLTPATAGTPRSNGSSNNNHRPLHHHHHHQQQQNNSDNGLAIPNLSSKSSGKGVNNTNSRQYINQHRIVTRGGSFHPRQSPNSPNSHPNMPHQLSSSRTIICLRNVFINDLTRSGLLGITTGGLVAVFKILIEFVRSLSYSGPIVTQYHFPNPLIPVLGGIMVGIVASSFCGGPFPPGLKGIIQETDRESKATVIFFSDECNKQFSPAAFFRKTVAAIFTLGTGSSLGPEGPSVELGVALSRIISSNMSPPSIITNIGDVITHNRLLLACGGAAGVAAGFNAPIAGIFFALEVIQGSFVTNPEVPGNSNLISTKGGISSIVLSAVLSALVSKTLLGDELAFKVARYSLKTPLLELPLYLLLGSICGVIAFLFSKLAAVAKGIIDGDTGPRYVRYVFTSIPTCCKPALGGLFCGLVGIHYPQILFFGYETLNNLLTKTNLTSGLLLQLLVVKMTTTSVAAGSGLVGGLFAPSLFFGGMLGAAFHNIIQSFLITWIGADSSTLAELPAYAMIGSASCLAALFRAPLTGSLILFECTREYDVILPLMASAGLASVVAEFLETSWNNATKKPNTTTIPSTNPAAPTPASTPTSAATGALSAAAASLSPTTMIQQLMMNRTESNGSTYNLVATTDDDHHIKDSYDDDDDNEHTRLFHTASSQGIV